MHLGPQGRSLLARLLVVLGIALTVVSVLADFVKREALDRGTFRQTAEELIANDAIREEVAATMVERLYVRVNVSAELQDQLPQNLRPLAGPIAGVSRELADRAAREVLERPRTQRLFVAASSAAQGQLIAVLEGDTRVVATTDGAVVLDIRPLVLELGRRFSFVNDLGERIPPGSARVTILRSDDLETAQDVTQALKAVASWVWVLALACWAAALWLVPGRRSREVRALGVGLAVAGLLLLVIRAAAGAYVVDHVVATEAVEPAASAAWEIITDGLAASAWVAVCVGALAVLGTWLAGQDRRAVALRRRLAPHGRHPEIAYSVLAVLLVALLWLLPAQELRTDVLLVVLAVGGTELLRRRLAREAPAAAPVEVFDELRDELGERLAGLRAAIGGAQPSRVDQLERLAKLHADGALTDEEFAAAKADLFR